MTIPDGVVGIGPRVFQNRTGITSVKIPASVISIGDRAFDGCTGITDVYYDGKVSQWQALNIADLKGSNSAIYYVTVHCSNNTTLTNHRPDTPTTPTGPQAAMPTNDKLTADGMVQAPTVYKINGSNYFKIRDLAAILNGSGKQFSVGYDASLNAVTATTGQSYAATGTELAGAATGNGAAEPSNDVIYVDGVKIQVEVYKIDGSNYFKLRDLGKALNFYVGWTAERGMFIETGASYSE